MSIHFINFAVRKGTIYNKPSALPKHGNRHTMKFVRIEFKVPSLEEARMLNEHSFVEYNERFFKGEYYGLPNGNWVFRLERFEDISFLTLALDADMSVRIIENCHHFKVENVRIW